MRKIKAVLRLKLDAKLPYQKIADALGLSKGVVTKYAGLAAAAGLDWQVFVGERLMAAMFMVINF